MIYKKLFDGLDFNKLYLYDDKNLNLISNDNFCNIINKYIKINEQYLLYSLLSSHTDNYLYDLLLFKDSFNGMIDLKFIQYLLDVHNVPYDNKIECFIKEHVINYYKVIPYIQKEIISIIMNIYIGKMITYDDVDYDALLNGNFKKIYVYVNEKNSKSKPAILMNNKKVFDDQIYILQNNCTQRFPEYLLYKKNERSFFQYINYLFRYVDEIDLLREDKEDFILKYVLSALCLVIDIIVIIYDDDNSIMYSIYNEKDIPFYKDLNIDDNINNFVIEYNYYTNNYYDYDPIKPYIMIDNEYNINFI